MNLKLQYSCILRIYMLFLWGKNSQNNGVLCVIIFVVWKDIGKIEMEMNNRLLNFIYLIVIMVKCE